MKKRILILLAILASFASTAQVSRLAVYNYWKNRVVPTTPSITSTWASFHNIIDDGIAWTEDGNALGSNTRFIGSTDNRSFIIRTNNTVTAIFDSIGRFSLTGGRPAYDFDMTKTKAAAQNILNVQNKSTSGMSSIQTYNEDATHFGALFQTNSASNVGDVYDNNSSFLDVYANRFGLVNSKSTGFISFNTGTFGTAGERMRIASDGKIGIGTTVANAYLHIRAGGASTPAIALTAQTAVSSPTAGNLWYETTRGFLLNGAITAIGTMSASGGTTLGTTSVDNIHDFLTGTGTVAHMRIRGLVGSTTQFAVYTGNAADASGNYIWTCDGTNNVLNCATSDILRVGNANCLQALSTGLNFYGNSGTYYAKLDSAGYFRVTPTTNGNRTWFETGVSLANSNECAIWLGSQTKSSTNHFVSYSAGNNGVVKFNTTSSMTWGRNGAVNLNLSSAGLFYIGGSASASAILHVGAGAASAGNGQMKLEQGQLLTTPEAGVFETASNILYYTPNTSRYQVGVVLTNSGTLDFGSAAAQTGLDLTITVTGAAVGDAVSIGLPATINDNVSFMGWVSAANTVTIRFNNYSASSVDPASGTYKATVIKN